MRWITHLIYANKRRRNKWMILIGRGYLLQDYNLAEEHKEKLKVKFRNLEN